jgi:TonB family protein
MTNPRLLLLCLIGLVLAAPVRAQEPNNDASIHKLRLDKFVMPEFPEFVRQSGNNKGVVTVAVGRDAEGRVTDVLVLSSSNARLSQSVVAAVEHWKFSIPANPAPIGTEIVPIVRFIFTSKGIAVVSALTGSLASKDRGIDENAPVVLPAFADLDAQPKPLNHPMPRITGSMAERSEGGSVTVRFFVDETGKVRVPIVRECSSPDLGRAVIAAVEQWSFEPPRAAGQPTITLETQTLNFAKPKS